VAASGDSPVIHTYAIADLLGDLNEIEKKYAPAELFAVGDLDAFFSGPRASIVGSREASQEGLKRAARAARELAAAGVVVVSGLAEGIDTAAHRAAIDTDGGRTVAVLGTPLNVVSPKSNTPLFEEIVEHHIAFSQFRIGVPVQRHSFPMRNRTMALLSDATIIVEAGEKSGTRHQGWEAIRLGRPLFLMESLLTAGLTWPREMIRYGAQVLTRDNITRVIDYLTPRALDVAI
jgi:DNA processing protein